ncbi:ESX secretion-associated protein EspG [Pseudonocardia phyllosphaerae]|uniref:ESX secretion-associated protein EspG n=1 Tax=Pseudonocardia phyllosphaerae TaxID=3390502 RepID=UPI003979400C
MDDVIEWPKAVVLSATEFDVARDVLDLGPAPSVLELLSPGATDVERARVVRTALASLTARGLFDGTTFRPGLVEDLRTVHAPEFQLDLVVPDGIRALAGVRPSGAVLAVRLGDEVGLVRVADPAAALVELLGPLVPGPGPAVRIPVRLLADAAEACDGAHDRLVAQLLRRGVPGAEAALLHRVTGGGALAQLGAGRKVPDARRAPAFLVVHATDSGCYLQRRPAPARIGGPLADDATIHARPAGPAVLAAELTALAVQAGFGVVPGRVASGTSSP